jgi:hypothetical protein
MIAKNGGKCLDYQPEVTGSPVVLNDCPAADPVVVDMIPGQRHEVFLRAGSKVIGVRRPPIIILSTPSTASWEELPLELQDPATDAHGLANQTFAIDGDSIIFAANRNLVAKVQNARGRNGSPIVVGFRNLSIEEFWDMRATDGSARFPTAAFKRVTAAEELLATISTFGCPDFGFPCAASEPEPGHVIVVDGFIELPRGLPSFLLPAGVTIRGDRRGIVLANLIRKPDAGKDFENLFEVVGNNVRITGLRIQGPSRSSSGDQEQSNGIVVQEHLRQGTIIDHNDISDWTWRGVNVIGGQDSANLECTDFTHPSTRVNHTWIARNFIHHNRQYEKGYGINANSGGFPLIDGNVFVENRHAIAGTNATPGTGYRAWHNFVLWAVPLQQGVFRTHDFDMHGTASGGKGGRAGGYVDMYRNTFMGTQWNRHNFEVRGTPCDYVEFRNNVSRQSKDDALSLDVGFFGSGSVTWVIPDTPEQFDLSDPTTSLGVGDFDGDGEPDSFLATGSAWYYSPHGIAEWRLINDNPDRLATLRFGDFDGDGRTDVLGKNGLDLVVSWGGVSEWEKVNEIDAPMSDLAVGDFDATGQADIFYADGATWFVAYDNGPFVPTQTSGFKVNRLRFGDFDADGRTDVFGIVSNAWRVSYSALSTWTFLRSRLSDTVDTLVVADFDGNGTDDVATMSLLLANPVSQHGSLFRWRVSRDGRGGWSTLGVTQLPAGVGRFVAGDPRSTVLFWNENSFWRATLGESAVPRHARQHMR